MKKYKAYDIMQGCMICESNEKSEIINGVNEWLATNNDMALIEIYELIDNEYSCIYGC